MGTLSLMAITISYILITNTGQIRLPIHFSQNIRVLYIIGQRINNCVMLLVRKPVNLLFAHCSAFEQIFVCFYFVKILLVLAHLLQLPVSFEFVYLIWQFTIFSVLVLLPLLLFSVHRFHSFPLVYLIYQIAFIHVFLLQLSFLVKDLPFFHSPLSLVDRIVDMIVLHRIPDRKWTHI